MKHGDLIRFNQNVSIVRLSETIVGIWISSRKTRWSDDILFHKVLTQKGVEEFPIRQEEIEVLS